MKYVALIQVDGHIMWVCNEDNSVRLFDDSNFAEQVARVLSPVIKIVTEAEFHQMLEERAKS
jgi:hypothetical protein